MVLMAITDNWLQFTLRYVVEFKRRRVIRDRMFTRVLEEMEKTGGTIRIASTTMEITLAGAARAAGWEGSADN